MLLNNIFIVSGCLFALSIVIGKLFIFKNKNIMMVSNYIAVIAALLGIYSVVGIMLAFNTHSILLSTIIILFATMPFILGQLANYYTEKYYTLLQIGSVIASVVLCKLYF